MDIIYVPSQHQRKHIIMTRPYEQNLLDKRVKVAIRKTYVFKEKLSRVLLKKLSLLNMLINS